MDYNAQQFTENDFKLYRKNTMADNKPTNIKAAIQEKRRSRRKHKAVSETVLVASTKPVVNVPMPGPTATATKYTVVDTYVNVGSDPSTGSTVSTDNATTLVEEPTLRLQSSTESAKSIKYLDKVFGAAKVEQYFGKEVSAWDVFFRPKRAAWLLNREARYYSVAENGYVYPWSAWWVFFNPKRTANMLEAMRIV